MNKNNSPVLPIVAGLLLLCIGVAGLFSLQESRAVKPASGVASVAPTAEPTTAAIATPAPIALAPVPQMPTREQIEIALRQRLETARRRDSAARREHQRRAAQEAQAWRDHFALADAVHSTPAPEPQPTPWNPSDEELDRIAEAATGESGGRTNYYPPSDPSERTQHVSGYTRKDGTHVNSYKRSPPRR